MPPERAHEAQRDPGGLSAVTLQGGPETRENSTPKQTLFPHRFLRLFGFPILRARKGPQEESEPIPAERGPAPRTLLFVCSKPNFVGIHAKLLAPKQAGKLGWAGQNPKRWPSLAGAFPLGWSDDRENLLQGEKL